MKRSEEETQFIRDWLAFARENLDMLTGMPEGEAVLANWYRGGYDIWTVADEPGEEVRTRIYECEWKLMEQYPDIVFDFNLLARGG